MKHRQFAAQRSQHLTHDQQRFIYAQEEERQEAISPQFMKYESRQHQRSSEYQQQLFSFDEPTCKQRQRSNCLNFSEFDITGNEKTLSRDIVKENIQLKEELLLSKQTIQQLRQKLINCEGKLEELSQPSSLRNPYRQAFIELRSELEAILQKNRVMESELNSLKDTLRRSKIQIEKEIHFERRSSKSLEKYKYPVIQINNQHYTTSIQEKENCLKDGLYLKRFEDLLASIKGMHSKIMGTHIGSLKELWRWLKNLGNLYSSLRKWKTKASQLIIHHHLRHDQLRDLISQALVFID